MIFVATEKLTVTARRSGELLEFYFAFCLLAGMAGMVFFATEKLTVTARRPGGIA